MCFNNKISRRYPRMLRAECHCEMSIFILLQYTVAGSHMPVVTSVSSKRSTKLRVSHVGVFQLKQGHKKKNSYQKWTYYLVSNISYSTHHNIIPSNTVQRGPQRDHAFVVSASLHGMQELHSILVTKCMSNKR